MNSLSSFPYTTNLLLGEDARKACTVEVQDLTHFLMCGPVVWGGRCTFQNKLNVFSLHSSEPTAQRRVQGTWEFWGHVVLLMASDP